MPLAGFALPNFDVPDQKFSGVRQQHFEQSEVWQKDFENCRHEVVVDLNGRYRGLVWKPLWKILLGFEVEIKARQFQALSLDPIKNTTTFYGAPTTVDDEYRAADKYLEGVSQPAVLREVARRCGKCQQEAAERAAETPDNGLIQRWNNVHASSDARVNDTLNKFAAGDITAKVFHAQYKADNNSWTETARRAFREWKEDEDPYRVKPVTRATPPSNAIGQNSQKQATANWNMADPEVLDFVKIVQAGARCELTWLAKWEDKYPPSQYPRLRRVIEDLGDKQLLNVIDNRRVQGAYEKTAISKRFRGIRNCADEMLAAKPSVAGPAARLKRVQWAYEAHMKTQDELVSDYLAGNITVSEWRKRQARSVRVWQLQAQTILR